MIIEMPRTGVRLKFLGQIVVGIAFIFLPGEGLEHIPRWIFPALGSWAIAQALFRMAASRRLVLGTEGGRVERAVGPIRWTKSVLTPNFRARVEKGDKDGDSNLEPDHVAIYCGGSRYRLLEGHSLAEREWVVANINVWCSPEK